MSYRYNPYRDVFEYVEYEPPNTAYGTGTASSIPVYTYPITYIADECIEKIADAVVRKMEGDRP